jgi:hypothetical protein
MLVPKPFICSGYAVNMFLLRHNGYHCIQFTSLQTALNQVYKHLKSILQFFCNILNTRQFAVESTYLRVHEISLSCAHSALHSLCLELRACLIFALEMAWGRGGGGVSLHHNILLTHHHQAITLKSSPGLSFCSSFN